jgi:endoglucanase
MHKREMSTMARSPYAFVFVTAALAAACGGQGTAERDGSVPLIPGGGGDTSAPPTVSSGPWVPPAQVQPGSAVDQFGQLSIQGAQLVNDSGAPVQLKGVSTMWLNWEKSYAKNKAGLQWMRDNWNLTVIRAAMGVEPQGAYLQSPLLAKSEVKTVIQNAIDVGVYVIVDWHDHNAHLHQAESIAFFTEIASEFGQYPNVIYEPYNEPENDDWATVIKPYHQAVVSAIRAVDPDNIVILGNRQWDQRPDQAAADPVAGTNLMYSVHFYACTHGAALRAFAESAHASGLPLFATEWGATNADGGRDGQVCVPEAQAWHDWLNQNNISWSAWRLQACTNEASCFFANASTPVDGNWTADMLAGHGPFVVERMREQPIPPAPL